MLILIHHSSSDDLTELCLYTTICACVPGTFSRVCSSGTPSSSATRLCCRRSPSSRPVRCQPIPETCFEQKAMIDGPCGSSAVTVFQCLSQKLRTKVGGRLMAASPMMTPSARNRKFCESMVIFDFDLALVIIQCGGH